MNSVLIIAQNTFKELLRDKALYILIFFALGLLVLSMLLTQLSIHEHLRIATDFGFSGIFLAIITMTMFIGGTLVFREIDKKSILFLMSYPLTRDQFILGKFLGFGWMLMTLLLGLGVLLYSLLSYLGWSFHPSFIIALYGIFLEILVLLGITFLFGVLIRPIVVIACAVAICLAGHGINSFSEIAMRGQSVFLKNISGIFKWTLPNLENMNWMNHVVYNEMVSSKTIFSATLYSLGWTSLFLVLAIIFFRRKDFV